MKKRPAGLSYRIRTSLVMALFAIVPFLIMIIGYIAAEEPSMVEDALSQYEQMLKVYSQQLDREFQEIETKTLYVKNNTTIRNYLNRMETMNMPEKLQFVAQLKETHSAISVDSDGMTMRWYSEYSDYNYGGYCYTMEDLASLYAENTQYLTKIHEIGNNETLMLVRGPELGAEKHVVSVYTKVDNIDGIDHILEVSMPISQMVYHAQLDMPEDSVVGVCFSQLGQSQTVVLLGEGEHAGSCLEEYYQTGSCKDYYPLEVVTSTRPEGRITCLLGNAYVWKMFVNARLPLLALIVVLIVTVLVCSYITSRMLTHKVIQFINHIDDELCHEAQERGNVKVEESDLSGIAQRVRDLVDRSREQGKQLEAHELEKKHMELELLQMRFNPHFLYNTLGSIRYQVKDKRIIQSIDSLIAYYRIVLSKGSLVISVDSEIQMIKEYLNLQTFAFNLQNVSYVYEIEEDIRQCTIIKHLLQPIVENALEHGVRGDGSGGTINVRAYPKGETVVFEVEDTGVGMTPEQITQVTTCPSGSLHSGGYGVYNVIQRIKTYYGPEYGVEFFSALGEGTRVVLTIPRRYDQNPASLP